MSDVETEPTGNDGGESTKGNADGGPAREKASGPHATSETNASTRIRAIADREFRTLTRRRSALVLAIAFVLGTLAVAWTATPRTYATLALTLAVPMQVGVPTLAFAFTYDAVVGDRERGELAVARTLGVPRWAYVGGIAAGRGLGVLAITLLGILLAAAVVPLAPHSGTFIATHGSLDSPVLYGRFIGVTALYTLVCVTVAITVSAVVAERGRALAAAVAALLVLVVGLDLLLALGVTGGILSGGLLDVAVAFDPVSAYRALAFDALPAVLTAGNPRNAGWFPVVGLLAWLAGGFVVAVVSAWTPIERTDAVETKTVDHEHPADVNDSGSDSS